MLSPLVRQKLRTFVARQNTSDLLVLNDKIESGDVTQIIDRTFLLSDAPDAIRYLETGQAKVTSSSHCDAGLAHRPSRSIFGASALKNDEDRSS